MYTYLEFFLFMYWFQHIWISGAFDIWPNSHTIRRRRAWICYIWTWSRSTMWIFIYLYHSNIFSKYDCVGSKRSNIWNWVGSSDRVHRRCVVELPVPKQNQKHDQKQKPEIKTKDLAGKNQKLAKPERKKQSAWTNKQKPKKLDAKYPNMLKIT